MHLLKEPLFSFELSPVQGYPLTCDIYDYEEYFEVRFEGDYAFKIAMGEDGFWVQTAGNILPDDMISDIGYKIEGYFD